MDGIQTRTALTIAGSDPGGGAGAQADLRAFGALGVAGLSVITALTAQNSLGVQAVFPVDADVLGAQLESVLTDTRPDAVKIGMLGGAASVRIVADAVRRYELVNVVLDPVLASTGGVALLDAEGRAALVHELVPLCELVTPNVDEANALDLTQARAVLLKGGHLPGDPVDTLTQAGVVHTFPGERVQTPHLHGTGCLLSAGIAGSLARGATLVEAISEAKRTLTQALFSPVVVGKGRGYPSPLAPVDPMTHHERVRKLTGVYALTDGILNPARGAARGHEAITRAALDGGATAIQLRDKRLSTAELTALARRLTGLCHERGALLIVNDRADVAFASDADGVHVGPGDIAPADARRLLGTNKLIGVSAGTIAEARAALPYASYIGVGAVFGTATKADAGPPVGVARLREMRQQFPSTPLVAIGGIGLDTIAEVAQAGANAAAVVSAIVFAPDMAGMVRALARRFWGT